MKDFLTIIHLEDIDADAELVARELRKGNVRGEIKRASNKQQFVDLLRKENPDIILSDHSLPSFDSEEALQMVRQSKLTIPFILVTATVSEEYAVKIMKQGATDYVLKDRMQRLPSAIHAAIEKFETETELTQQLLLQQKLVAETNIKAQEKVRQEIGVELHDNINQILAASKLYLDKALSYGLTDTDLLQRSKVNIVKAIEEIRRLSHRLVAPTLADITLIQIVNDLIDEIHETTSIHVHLTIRNFREEVIDKDTKLTVYRIIQEQINNIVKHSKAENAYIRLAASPEAFFLTVQDDGIGFDTRKLSSGIGLQNIKNRIEFYDGTVTIHSEPNQGSSLQVSIPVKSF